MAHGQGMAERIERLQADGWNSQAVNQIAGISYSYAGERAGPGPIPGDRAPDAPLGGGRRIYDLIDVDRPTVLLAVSSTSSATARSPSAEIGDELRRRYVAPPVVAAVDGRAFHDSYDCANGGSAVVARPDRHIAHRGPIADMSGLRDSLDSMLVRR
jgi:hypothetical protein